MTLLTYAQAAKRLAISVSHVRVLACAAKLADRNVQLDRVPPKLRPYLNSGFPRARLIGGSRRLARIDGEQLEKWIADDAIDQSGPADWEYQQNHMAALEEAHKAFYARSDSDLRQDSVGMTEMGAEA